MRPVVLRAIVAPPLLAAALGACAHSGGTPKSRAPADAPTVTADDVERAAAGGQPVETTLDGRISGVTVMRTNGGIAVRVRGATSFSGDAEPLFIVDGTPTAAGPGGALSGISPNDVASIRVLKDPADLTMYGSRGANGVVVITTKRAARPRQ